LNFFNEYELIEEAASFELRAASKTWRSCERRASSYERNPKRF